MLDSQIVCDWLSEYTEDSDFFVVRVIVRPGEELEVEVDRDGGLSSDECSEICRFVNEKLEAQGEDWCVTVGSPGLTSPMRMPRQFLKNVGRDVEVLQADGKKIRGKLLRASDGGFTIEVGEKVRREGKKRPEVVLREMDFSYAGVKSVVVALGKR
ncbi:MAG: hypothetical protein CSA97_03550 [Bacteroidetes bacterium]|nr:MAG: hypothetical protein CSA97_03550 [Bacteroidota bacterium]